MRQYGIAPASADASFRRYFRVTRAGQASLIVMDAPPGKEDVTPYLRVAAMLQEIGVHAPRVLQRSEPEGFLLLTDLGTTMYLPELTKPGQADPLYADALTALVQIQARGAQAAAELPPYDEKLLRFEMSLFPDWLLQRHLAMELSAREAQVVEKGRGAYAIRKGTLELRYDAGPTVYLMVATPPGIDPRGAPPTLQLNAQTFEQAQ